MRIRAFRTFSASAALSVSAALSAGLLAFAFVTLVGVYALNRSYRLRVS